MIKKTAIQTIFVSTVTPDQTFTAAAATDLITATAHGLSEGDVLQFTTATTLPAGLSLATDYYVISPTTNTFKVSATRGGTAVNITDAGTGAHTYHLKGKRIYVGDHMHNILMLDFNTTPTMTVKFQHSISDDAPDFNAAASAVNSWDYVDVIDNEDGASIDGDTGIACAGTADHRILMLNTNRSEWITVAITAYTAGKLGITVKSWNND